LQADSLQDFSVFSDGAAIAGKRTGGSCDCDPDLQSSNFLLSGRSETSEI